MGAYFAYINNTVVGPYSQAEVCRMVASGRISLNTQLEREGGDGTWAPLGEFPELLVSAVQATDVLSGIFDREQDDKVYFRCPSCNQKYKIQKPQGAGTRIYCKNCDSLVSVPTVGQDYVQSLENARMHHAAPTYDESSDIPDGALTCPHCWKSFDQENLLYIAVHPSLVGDPIVGEFEPQRFKPGVFNQLGQPLDACGLAATEMACPYCHLRFPAGMLDSPSLYFSIAGATASGKSYFITCQSHVLRSALPRYYGISFFDLDPRLNSTLARYENQLFMPAEAGKITALPATQLSGEGISDSILLDGVQIELPKPFVFDYQPDDQPEGRRNLVFYDNSGELFTPGRDEWVNQATRHLSHANGITFLFDPANDSGMRRSICNPDDPQVKDHPRTVDQTTLLIEMISRIRRHANMSSTDACDIPLVVAVCKYDMWREHFACELGSPYCAVDENSGLDLGKVLDVSYALRELMLRYVPGLVTAAESFFSHVYFVPVSAFGTLAEMNEHGYIGVVSEKINPIWIEVPFLVLMHECGELPAVETAGRQDAPDGMLKAKIQGKTVMFQHPETKLTVRLPLNYAGARLTLGGKTYDLPKVAGGKEQKSKSVWF